MKFEIVKSLDEQAWREFITEQPGATIFHSPEMCKVFNQVKGHKSHLWAAVDSGGRVQALITPVEVTLMDGVLANLTTRMIAYGSVLYAPTADGEAALTELLQTYRAEIGQQALFTELRNLYDLSSIQPTLESCQFEFEEYLNYLIDLDRPAEDVLQSIGKRTRKIIRKGLRDQAVQVSEVTDRSELVHWYNILQKTYGSAQIPLADRTMFEAAFDELFPKGMAKFLLAKVNGTGVACSVELPYKDTIYGWYGGTDRNFGKYASNEMLMWYILEWGANNGYKVYDFGGAGKPDEEYGVRDFKAKFNGELVSFGRNTAVHSPQLLRLSKWGYGLFRKWL